MEMEMNLPSWLQKDRLEKALENYLKIGNVCITDVVSTLAVPIGENYTSDLFRALITYTTNQSKNFQKFSVIIKCMGGTGKGLLANSLKIFEKEALMFGETISKLYKVLGESNLAADCLIAELKPYELIILQDLKPLGYRMGDRCRGLDFDHSLMVLEKLAKFHAASAVLYEKEPEALSQYTRGVLINQFDNELVKGFLINGLKSLALSMTNWTGYEKYSKKLFKLLESDNIFFKKCTDIGIRKPGQFCVLNHGDFWTNNFLFLYDKLGKIKDIKLLDFQFCVFGSPALDLQYYFCTSLQQSIEEKQIIRLLEYYHEQLIDNLTRLNYPNYKIPNYQHFYEDFVDMELYALATVLCILPLIRGPSSDDATFDELLRGDNDKGFRNLSYNCKEFREITEKLIPRFDAHGLLDCI